MWTKKDWNNTKIYISWEQNITLSLLNDKSSSLYISDETMLKTVWSEWKLQMVLLQLYWVILNFAHYIIST